MGRERVAHGGQHAFGPAHHEHVAEQDALAGVGDGPGGIGPAARGAVRPPESRREVWVAGRALRGRDDTAARVEEHDGHVEDRRDPLDELAHVLLLDDQLEQLDLQRRRAAQRVHVPRCGGPGVARVGGPVLQGRLEGLSVQPDLVLEHDRRLEQAEVGALDVHARLRAVHERVHDLVEPGDLGLESLRVPGVRRLPCQACPASRPGVGGAEPRATAVSVWLTCTPQNCSP